MAVSLYIFIMIMAVCVVCCIHHSDMYYGADTLCGETRMLRDADVAPETLLPCVVNNLNELKQDLVLLDDFGEGYVHQNTEM